MPVDARTDLLQLPAVRKAIEQLQKKGKLREPGAISIADAVLVIDIDDHVSDENLGGGRVRTVVMVTRDGARRLTTEQTRALARALADGTDPPPKRRR